MQTPISLKAAERKAFQTTFVDGLWDVLIGCFILEFALAPLLSETMGDFWSSAVFLPFWGLVYLAIWLVRKQLVVPRLGQVRFGSARRQKLHSFTLLMLSINSLALLLGIWAFLTSTPNPAGQVDGRSPLFSVLIGIFMLVGFSLAGYLLDYPRLYVYGLLLFAAPFLGEWLSGHYGASHHGFPVVFGFTSGAMIITGLVTFIHFLKNNPAIEIPSEAA